MNGDTSDTFCHNDVRVYIIMKLEGMLIISLIIVVIITMIEGITEIAISIIRIRIRIRITYNDNNNNKESINVR